MKILKRTLTVLFALNQLYCAMTEVKEEEKKFKLSESMKNDYEIFFNNVPIEEITFRVFAAASFYERRQIHSHEIIEAKEDFQGDKMAAEELKKYNKVNFYGKALLKIELYPASGALSRVRFLRSSGISELDRIISEDITRWKFSFLVENTKDDEIPEQFMVEYAIFLEKNITRDEAVEELKKYVR